MIRADEPLSVHGIVGSEFFVELVDLFYEGVDSDELLRPMYPQELAGARARLALFLVQYWGGPTTYSDDRGHPRLRMRHGRFEIDQAARDAWLGHMLAALKSTAERRGTAAAVVDEMQDYFVHSAEFLRNTAGGDLTGSV